MSSNGNCSIASSSDNVSGRAVVVVENPTSAKHIENNSERDTVKNDKKF